MSTTPCGSGGRLYESSLRIKSSGPEAVMNDNDILLKIKIDTIAHDLQKAAEEVVDLVSPLNAASLYAEDLTIITL